MNNRHLVVLDETAIFSHFNREVRSESLVLVVRRRFPHSAIWRTVSWRSLQPLLFNTVGRDTVVGITEHAIVIHSILLNSWVSWRLIWTPEGLDRG